ncbi:MAG: 50S ribosomal protein L29 [Chlamydiae bacterium]|nr:50S ribosomal protein L29 [Chlamydiota bacterium]
MRKETKLLRDQTITELKELHKEEERKLFDLINENRVNKKLDKPHRLNAAKKKIARILTLTLEKQREEKA